MRPSRRIIGDERGNPTCPLANASERPEVVALARFARSFFDFCPPYDAAIEAGLAVEREGLTLTDLGRAALALAAGETKP